MTTRLTKAVAREVHDPRHGLLVITYAPEGVYCRYKGRRTLYGPVTYGKILLEGARLRALADRQAKQAKKTSSRRTR